MNYCLSLAMSSNAQCNSCSCVPAKNVTTDNRDFRLTATVLATHEGFTITHQFFPPPF